MKHFIFTRNKVNFDNRIVLILCNAISVVFLFISLLLSPLNQSVEAYIRLGSISLFLLCLYLFLKFPKSSLPYYLFALLCTAIGFTLSLQPGLLLVDYGRSFIAILMLSLCLKPQFSWVLMCIVIYPVIHETTHLDWPLQFEVSRAEAGRMLNILIMSGVIYLAWELNRSHNHKRHFKKVRRVLAQLNERRRQTTSMSEFKDQLITKTSHDIRTPLNVIYSEVQTYENTHEMDVNLVKSKMTDLIDLMDNILELKSTQSDIQAIKPIWTHHSQIKESFTQTLNGIQDNQHQIRVFTEDQDYHYFLDHHTLMRGVAPLIRNSFEYSTSGLIEVDFYIIKQTQHLAQLRILIRDQGPGMPLGKINELFHQKNQYKKAPELGMGINIARHYLIERLNCTWDVRNRDPRGLEVEVQCTVPYQFFDTTKLQQIEESLRGQKVLIVDDIKINTKVMEKVLKPLEVTCTSVYSGQQAIDLCKQFHFDYVLMDLRMPSIDGFEATEEILKHDFQGSIIAITAEKGGNIVAKALKVGMKDVIFKPVNLEDLRSSLISHSKIQ